MPGPGRNLNNTMSAYLSSSFSNMFVQLGRFWDFSWQVLVHGFLARRREPAAAARSRLYAQMYEIGARSVPVVMITGAFVGMTLAVQTYNQFRALGIAERMGTMINIAVVKEFGPVLAALMLAGRVGGALTAELGTMRVTEQIDALRVMGADPIRFLVTPRLLACIVLTPFLTIYADILGVFGGYVVSCWYYGVSSQAYWQFSAEGVEKWDVITGAIKGLFFGASIGLISCFYAFRCNRGARGVGRACTHAFVHSFISILVINFVLTVVFRSIYEAIWGMSVIKL